MKLEINNNSNNTSNNNNINNNNNNKNHCGPDILGWCAASDNHVSWVGRALKYWLATFLEEGKP